MSGKTIYGDNETAAVGRIEYSPDYQSMAQLHAPAAAAMVMADIKNAEFAKLVQCRQDELAYIRGVLEAIRRREGEPPRAQAIDLLAWLNSRATCYPAPTFSNDSDQKR